MKVVFLSNYFNHHQKGVSDEIKDLVESYYFISTVEIPEYRKKLGYKEEFPNYVIESYKSEELRLKAQKLIDEADVLIFGSAPFEMIKNRLKSNKLTFIYSERIYKDGFPWFKYPLIFLRHYLKYRRYKNMYLLCASAYTYSDFLKTGCFKNKAYKFGYFPEFINCKSVDCLISNKQKNSILWVGRLIDLKHPELAIELAKYLKEKKYEFKIRFIGNGELYPKLIDLADKNQLNEHVEFIGAISPEEVRKNMDESEIFLFTSNKKEGWGAVLNESLNSACAVVASHEIGSVPFLLKNNENSLIFKSCEIKDLCNKVEWLINNPKERERISRNAYNTISSEWNAHVVAKRLIELSENLLQNKNVDIFEQGPLSKSIVLKDNWFINKHSR